MLTWVETGRRRASRTRRYTQVTAELPVTEWATDELSAVYDRVSDAAHTAMQEARANIMATSRVDTGFMRSMVESTLATPGDSFVLEFGWWEGVPHYAPYQEFGTRHIEPMLAVQREYLKVPQAIVDAVAP